MRYLKGLRECRDTGEGEVRLSHDFLSMNGLYRMDVIGDWISDLHDLYADALIDHDIEMESYRVAPPALEVV